MSQAAQQVMALVSVADRTGALDLAMAFAEKGERHPLILMLAAERFEEKGQLTKATRLLEQALPQADAEPELWRRYGVILGRQGLNMPSRQAFERALALAPEQPAIVMGCATVCFMLGDLDAAAAHYRHAARLLPASAEPLAALASIAAARHDAGQAEQLARQALALEPANVTARIALARAALESGRAAEAEQLAGALLSILGSNGDQRVALLGLRADARDALGNSSGAFEDYTARSALLVARYTPLLASLAPERRLKQARRLKAHFDAAAAERWSAPLRFDPPLKRPCKDHLFIIGFPRSGTTLLEKALSGHGDVRTIPEIECLTEIGGEYLTGDYGLSQLSQLSRDEIERLRERYFEKVTGAVGPIDDKVIVDKLPLHTLALPLIVRLFPDAKIILSLRDPRDVVFSCFRRRFQMNAAMFEMLTLDGAAQYYDAVMALAESYRAKLPIDLHELRHERLVDDFEGEVTRVLGLVGLDWDPEIADFAGRAAADARTPSDYQLTQGLNREGIGSWRRYADQMRPVLPSLGRWVRHWGYPS